MDEDKKNISEKIKAEALRLGFLACGIAKAEKLTGEEERLETYLKNGYHGQMRYMENHFEKRLDPTKLEEGTNSVIVLLYNYYTPVKQKDTDAPILSKYAYGVDYHFVIKDKLKLLLKYIQEKFGKINGRCFVDSAPILERAWAQKAGLGWIGKNGNLINKNFGSFFFISEILVDIELEPNKEIQKNYCGQCKRCIEACPTNAIVNPGVVDGSKCISYLTIELKEEIPVEFKGKLEKRMFGCDICQDVCPFNIKRAKRHTEKQFEPSELLLNMAKEDWMNITQEKFSEVFKKSAVKRTKLKGLKRNIDFLYNNFK